MWRTHMDLSLATDDDVYTGLWQLPQPAPIDQPRLATQRRSSVLRSRQPDAELASGPGSELDLPIDQAPRVEEHGNRDCTGAAREGFRLDSPFVRPITERAVTSGSD